MTATLTINPEIIEQKIEVVFGALGGLVTSSMIHVGHELGLYRAMAGKGAVTAARLAADAGLMERFVCEWLAQQAACGIVESRSDRLFELSPEAALVFADDDNPASQIAIFAYLPAMQELFNSSKLEEDCTRMVLQRERFDTVRRVPAPDTERPPPSLTLLDFSHV
jgi:hypothetical protein